MTLTLHLIPKKINHMNRIVLTLILILLLNTGIKAEIRYHCPEDSVRAMEIVKKAGEGETYGDKIVAAAKAMEGVPLGKPADNDIAGTIMIRLDTLSRREFINMAIAAAKTAQLSRPTLAEFESNLENVSRKKGKDEGFASQFMYGADWIVDNVYRGNLKEMTEYLDGGSYRTKTLDFVTRHPELYPAMADSVTAEKVRIAEFGYRSHRLPHLKKQSIGNKTVKELLQNGDIILMSPMETDFDIYDIGIVSIEKGEPTLIHIPKDKEAVALDPYPLPRLFKIEGQFFYGYRWLRPIE